jgi:hypothetical protein
MNRAIAMIADLPAAGWHHITPSRLQPSIATAPEADRDADRSLGERGLVGAAVACWTRRRPGCGRLVPRADVDRPGAPSPDVVDRGPRALHPRRDPRGCRVRDQAAARDRHARPPNGAGLLTQASWAGGGPLPSYPSNCGTPVCPPILACSVFSLVPKASNRFRAICRSGVRG